jgi:hypothetical protein
MDGWTKGGTENAKIKAKKVSSQDFLISPQNGVND